VVFSQIFMFLWDWLLFIGHRWHLLRSLLTGLLFVFRASSCLHKPLPVYVGSHKYLPRNRSLLNGRNEGWGPRWEPSLVLLLLLVYSSTDDCSVLLLVDRKELLLAVEVHITEMRLSEVKKVSSMFFSAMCSLWAHVQTTTESVTYVQCTVLDFLYVWPQ